MGVEEGGVRGGGGVSGMTALREQRRGMAAGRTEMIGSTRIGVTAAEGRTGGDGSK